MNQRLARLVKGASMNLQDADSLPGTAGRSTHFQRGAVKSKFLAARLPVVSGKRARKAGASGNCANGLKSMPSGKISQTNAIRSVKTPAMKTARGVSRAWPKCTGLLESVINC